MGYTSRRRAGRGKTTVRVFLGEEERASGLMVTKALEFGHAGDDMPEQAIASIDVRAIDGTTAMLVGPAMGKIEEGRISELTPIELVQLTQAAVQYTVRWTGISDVDSTPIPYTEENAREVYADDFTLLCIVIQASALARKEMAEGVQADKERAKN